jgi:NAD(P)-dependent dehydrogenase (short-subunit alcohol dehydrogenase family)
VNREANTGTVTRTRELRPSRGVERWPAGWLSWSSTRTASSTACELLSVGPDVDRASLSAPHPTGRVAGPEEVAAFVAFLLCDEARFVTGATLALGQ